MRGVYLIGKYNRGCMSEITRLEVTPKLKIFREVLWDVHASCNQEVYHTVYSEEGKPIAYVLTELIHDAVIPHISIKSKYRHKCFIQQIKDVFTNEYVHEAASRGYKAVYTTCDVTDTGTQWLLDFLGFDTQPVVLASYSLKE